MLPTKENDGGKVFKHVKSNIIIHEPSKPKMPSDETRPQQDNSSHLVYMYHQRFQRLQKHPIITQHHRCQPC